MDMLLVKVSGYKAIPLMGKIVYLTSGLHFMGGRMGIFCKGALRRKGTPSQVRSHLTFYFSRSYP